jgi:hypothetical protein
MNDAHQATAGWKQKFIAEMIEYGLMVVYLACFFGVFTWYRRFILAAYAISYMHYGVSLLEALVLAKVILIGEVLRLGRRLDDKPLMVPTLYKALVFSLWVGVFGVLEHIIGGLLRKQGLAGGVEELMRTGKYELLARCLVMFVAFIPFFAFKELERVLGEGKIRTLFFRGRAATASDLAR